MFFSSGAGMLLVVATLFTRRTGRTFHLRPSSSSSEQAEPGSSKQKPSDCWATSIPELRYLGPTSSESSPTKQYKVSPCCNENVSPAQNYTLPTQDLVLSPRFTQPQEPKVIVKPTAIPTSAICTALSTLSTAQLHLSRPQWQ
jgi:hypothetical protein